VVTPALLVQVRNGFFAHARFHDCGTAGRHGRKDGGGTMIERQHIFPEGMPKRIVNGHLLYTPVVTVVPGKLVFVSGILSRNSKGEIVGKGDMAAQIAQVFENIRTALAAAGATMADVVKRQTFTTDIDAYFANIDARMAHGGDHNSTSTTVEVRRLSHPDFLIEVEVMAVIPER
jgi:enamine deaminase RidA (YjgF/YER057c/UK114 family)